MDSLDLRFMTMSQLRKRQTHLNKALIGAAQFPTGLTRMVSEDCVRELKMIKIEMDQRKKAAR